MTTAFWMMAALALIVPGLAIITQGGRILGTSFVAIGVGIILILIVAPARAHDHSRPELAEWFKGLKSGKGMCCDGLDAVHLSDTDWITQNKPNSHYRVQIPRTKEGFEAALKGEVVAETMWIDIPDEAIVNEPNKSGAPQVWPLYGYMGISIRCFMAGTLT